MRRLVLAAAAAATALVAGQGAGASSQQASLRVYFLQGEQLHAVTRSGTTPEEAVRALVAGPTRPEAGRGVRTYVPAGTPVRGVTVANGVATVDLGARFMLGTARSRLARLSQLVGTLTGLAGTTSVQLLIDGQAVSGVFPGVPTASPVTLRFLQTPNVALPKAPPARLRPPNPKVKRAQERLIELGYLLKGDADGRFGPVTQNGIVAFQKWERLDRTGLLDAATAARLESATRPAPLSRGGAGKRAEVLLDRQLALLIRGNEVVRAIAVSSGKAVTPTPPGDYRVYAKIARWWSVPFREWLPWAVPFVGGIAFHEYRDVPIFPASHGCLRQAFAVARWTYDFSEVGMPVKVLARS